MKKGFQGKNNYNNDNNNYTSDLYSAFRVLKDTLHTVGWKN